MNLSSQELRPHKCDRCGSEPKYGVSETRNGCYTQFIRFSCGRTRTVTIDSEGTDEFWRGCCRVRV